MYRILKKRKLNPTVTELVVEAPAVARKARAGQFVILRVDEEGERIPLTVAGCDRETGGVTVIFQTVGATTALLAQREAGEYLSDFVGPLGRPTDIEGHRRVAVVGGGVGCAIAYPVACAFANNGCEVDVIAGFRTRDLVILEEEFAAVATRFLRMSDDGSWGERGLVTDALRRRIEEGAAYDEVITIGPLPMMKYVALLTREFDIPTVASMNPIMIDGTGMCGGCRLTVGGKTRFACVDGPEFNAHEIDFDEAIARSSTYREFERHAYESTCNLFQKEVE